jgi:curved DNA-binding protein CbpA|eukprot:gene17595-12591_t
MVDLYRVLNVHRGATLSEIKVAYRKLAKQLHPDLNKTGGRESEDAFKAVNHAYRVLSDEKMKEEYDRTIGVRDENWIPKSRPFTGHKTPSGPGFKTTYSSGTGGGGPVDETVFNTRVWKAWHYGDDAIVMNAVRQAAQNTGPMSKQDRYFARMQEKDKKEADEMLRAWRQQQEQVVKNAASDLQSRREQRRQEKKPEKDIPFHLKKDPKENNECTVS